MLSQLNWLNVRQLGKYLALTLVHRIRIGDLLTYFDDILHKCNTTHNYETCNRDNCHVRTKRLKVAHKSAFVRGIVEYDELPMALRDIATTVSFKQKLKFYLLDNS